MKKEVTWTEEEWKDWKWHQKHRIRNIEQLEEWIDQSEERTWFLYETTRNATDSGH